MKNTNKNMDGNSYIFKKSDINKYCSVSDGNLKIHSNEFYRVLIFNLPAVKTCPFRTKQCEKFCYARKAEKLYKDCLASRERNFNFSKTAEFVQVISEYINLIVELEKKGKGRKVLVRIHESGDFYNKEYTDKWIEIARRCPDVTFYAYTKSIVFFDSCQPVKNLTIRASIWRDTKPELMEDSFKRFPIYTAYDKKTVSDLVNNKGWNECECRDCTKCGKCYDCSVKNIACVIH